jgi:hypothetical protein
MSSAIEELIELIQRVSSEVEILCVRGVRHVDQARAQWLASTRDSFAAMGAEYLAGKMNRLIEAFENHSINGPAALLDLMTTLRVSERRLTLQLAETQLPELGRILESQNGLGSGS